MAERARSQIVLVSTAHRFATGLMQSRRATAIEQLDDPRDTLLLEWSAPATPTSTTGPRGAWRHRTGPTGASGWSRRSTVAPSPARPASTPTSPIRWRRSERSGSTSGRRASWRSTAAANRSCTRAPGRPSPSTGSLPAGELVLGLEDWFGQGAAAAAAGRSPRRTPLRMGKLLPAAQRGVRVALRPRWRASREPPRPGREPRARPRRRGHPGRGARARGPGRDSDRAAVAARARGGESTRARRRRRTRGQVEGCRVVESRAGGLQVAPGPQRTDLLRAAAWALAVLARLPVPEEEPAIF